MDVAGGGSVTYVDDTLLPVAKVRASPMWVPSVQATASSGIASAPILREPCLSSTILCIWRCYVRLVSAGARAGGAAFKSFKW